MTTHKKTTHKKAHEKFDATTHEVEGHEHKKSKKKKSAVQPWGPPFPTEGDVEAIPTQDIHLNGVRIAESGKLVCLPAAIAQTFNAVLSPPPSYYEEE